MSGSELDASRDPLSCGHRVEASHAIRASTAIPIIQMTRDLILHGHFYQPPREDPWTGEVPVEPGAMPFHDWNERILAECYRSNAFARVYEKDRILAIGNNYELMSFNFGPTLLQWLERHDPVTLTRVVDADRRSVGAHGGHGNAIAQAYHHPILPLADALDRATEIRWGLADFRYRFGRDAEAMWLPECAADNATLGALVEAGLRYAILAPAQAARVRPPGGSWRPARPGFEAGRPYRWRDPGGGSGASGAGGSGHRGGTLAVFFYDGPLAQSIAFGGGLGDSRRLLAGVEAAATGSGRRLVHAAVDGETAGHHQRFGERVVQHVLGSEAAAHGFRVTNYGQHLAEHAPAWDVELDLGPDGLGSSWSCAHGVGRWRRDCGCRLRPETSQTWRGPLREAFDYLRDRGRAFYTAAAEPLFQDPWAARDAYVAVRLQPTAAARARFLDRHAYADLLPRERARALVLLEMQCDLLAMYTSCGWFFDDIAGIESRIVLRRAARALARWRDLGAERAVSPAAGAALSAPPYLEVLALLEQAKCNDPVDPSTRTGADLLRQLSAREMATPPSTAPPLASLGAPPAVGEITNAATAALLAELRRWLAAGERTAPQKALAVLANLAAGARTSSLPDLERAQEIYTAAILERGEAGPPRALAWEIGIELGFSPALLARAVGQSLPAAPASIEMVGGIRVGAATGVNLAGGR